MRKHILTSLISMLSIVPAHSVGTNAYISVSASDIPDGRKSVDTVSSDLPNIEVKSLKNKKRVSSSTPQYNLDSEIIRQTGITDISEAMRRLPGVNLRDYGGAGGLKTVSVRGLGSEHTAVIYDGVSLSDCQSGQIDLSRYSIDNVRSLSLYSGDNDDIFLPAKAAASASSLYISSFTSTDDADFHLKSQMKIGSFGYYNPYIRLGKGNDNDRGFSYSANAEYIHSENDYPFILTNGDLITHEKRENSRMNSWLGEFNGMYRFGDSSRIVGKVYYYDNSRDLPGQVIYYVNGSNEHLRDRNFFGQFQYKGRLSSKFSLASTAKFNWSSSRYTDIDGKYPGGILDNYYIQRETYFTGALLFTPFSGFSMDYSLDWSWNNLSSNLKTDIRPYRNSILQTLAAKYKVWQLTVMARALYSLYINKAKDGDAGKNNRRLSPSVMLSLKPIADVGWYIRTSYKNIFRVPTFNEAYFDHYGSINLDPEITDQFNFGMTFESNATFLSNITLTCDGYINHVKNKIVAVPYNMFVWRMTNLGKVRVFGLDATISSEYVVTDKQSLILTGSYSYQRAQPRTNPRSSEWMKQVAYIPLNSGSASLSWLNPWVNGVIHFTGCSPRYTTNSNIPETKIDGYCDFGFSVSRTFMLKNKNKFRIQGDLLNVFNRQYEIVARYPMPGRSWKISVEFEM